MRYSLLMNPLNFTDELLSLRNNFWFHCPQEQRGTTRFTAHKTVISSYFIYFFPSGASGTRRLGSLL
uniref:Uncharacterized protein n=1 Tax=Picea glauca TaxID=3330 RepID=A0A101M1W2_PICGL|nr:hypothetical protein ABT39_MTgene2759 [Picea glauca]